jgi:hypothetical protein
MCEFCVKHGDGKKWYLAMENYSWELLHQQKRIGYMGYFANTFEERIPRSLTELEKLSRTPFLNIAKPFLTRSHMNGTKIVHLKYLVASFITLPLVAIEKYKQKTSIK